MASLAVAPPAQAAPPRNDDWQDATAVTTLAFADTTDTTEATRDAPPEAPNCWSNGYGHSVWYRLELSTSKTVVVTTTGSDYNTVLNVYRAADGQTPNQWKHLACDNNSGEGNTAAVGLDVEAGAVYYVMASGRRSADSGELRVRVRRSIAVVDAGLAKRGRVDRVDGSAVLRGRLTCNRAGRARVGVILRQRIGDTVAEGFGSRSVECTKRANRFRLRVHSDNGVAFDRGRARVSGIRFVACEPGVVCSDLRMSRRLVRLR